MLIACTWRHPAFPCTRVSWDLQSPSPPKGIFFALNMRHTHTLEWWTTVDGKQEEQQEIQRLLLEIGNASLRKPFLKGASAALVGGRPLFCACSKLQYLQLVWGGWQTPWICGWQSVSSVFGMPITNKAVYEERQLVSPSQLPICKKVSGCGKLTEQVEPAPPVVSIVPSYQFTPVSHIFGSECCGVFENVIIRWYHQEQTYHLEILIML